MGQDDSFRVVFSGDNNFSVELSDEFLSSSREEQMGVLKALLGEKNAAPISTNEVSNAAAQNEITIILLETFLTKLKRGERIVRDSEIGISFEDLVTL